MSTINFSQCRKSGIMLLATIYGLMDDGDKAAERTYFENDVYRSNELKSLKTKICSDLSQTECDEMKNGELKKFFNEIN